MAVTVRASTSFEASLISSAGLTGTVGVRVVDGQGATTIARTTSGIIETPAGSGVYVATITAPVLAGQYQIVWDTGGSGALYGVEDLTVTPPLSFSDPATDLIPLLDQMLERGGGDPARWSDELKSAALEAAIEHFQTAAGRVFFVYAAEETIRLRCFEDRLKLSAGSGMNSIVSIDALTGPDGDIDTSALEVRGRRLIADDGWPAGTYTISYTYGLQTTPSFVARAMAMLAAAALKDGPWDDRGYSVSADGEAVRLLTAGVAGASFSIPDVQSALTTVRVPLVGGA